jgi:RNA polymerase sigma-70 factor (ECF subfamily)
MGVSMKTTATPQPNIPGRRDPPGDRDAFDRLVGPYRRELKVHCYRMMGSLDEAEDTVQETFVRAWRGLNRLENHGFVRAWLYRIATNACLNALASRARAHRVLPDSQAPPSNHTLDGQRDSETAWVEPYPDSEIEGIADGAAGPAARYELAESVRLAFVAAIQQLPSRQRAVLLLCDVLGWPASEVALLLGGATTSVNSALQRARGTLGKHYSNDHARAHPLPNELQRALLDRYVRAWEHKDLDGFVELLREDAVYRMPPWPRWYQGREAIREFFKTVWKSYGAFRLVPTSANRQPAFAIYTCREAESTWRAHSIQLLELEQESIVSLTKYMAPVGPKMFSSFGLSAALLPNADGEITR